MHILSFNLRVNVSVDGKHAWPYRRDAAIDFMKEKEFDVIGLQEVTPDMYQDLLCALPHYHFIYQPRDTYGEAAPLLVKKDSFEIIEENTFWLTDTPFVQSKLAGSAFHRTASYAVLKSKNGHMFACFNTHLDYLDGHTIYHQTAYLYEMMNNLAEKYQASLILTGDMNQHPLDQAIKFLSHYLESSYQDITDYGLTYHGFSSKEDGLPIDYIFYSKDLLKTAFKIHHHTSDTYLSDHYPISIKLKK